MHFDQSGSRILTRPKLIKLLKLIQSFDWNNSEGKASLKQQKSPETTTDTQDASVIDFTSKILYFEIFIVVSRPYFVPHTIPYNVFKF